MRPFTFDLATHRRAREKRIATLSEIRDLLSREGYRELEPQQGAAIVSEYTPARFAYTSVILFQRHETAIRVEIPHSAGGLMRWCAERNGAVIARGTSSPGIIVFLSGGRLHRGGRGEVRESYYSDRKLQGRTPGG